MKYPKHTEILIADPPWPFRDKLPGESRGAGSNSSLLSLEDIQQYPIPQMKDDSVLFLWRVASMQEEALSVAQAWGFEVKSEIVWYKKTKYGKPWFGMGRSVRMSHEVCLIATRGKWKPESRSIRSVFEAKVPYNGEGKVIHSGKPDEFYDLVKNLTTGVRVELFARKARPGFRCYGEELPT